MAKPSARPPARVSAKPVARASATPVGKTDAKAALPKVSDETLRGYIGYHMKRAFNVVQADLTETLKPYELRMLTYTALVLIADNPGLRQFQLADAMDIERPNLVLIIDELERRELILRERVPTDRRAYALTVTLAGQRLYEKAGAAVRAHEMRFQEVIGEARRAQVIEAMQLIRNISETG